MQSPHWRFRPADSVRNVKDADLHFYFDPICPFAWMTSKWVRTVAAQRDYSVDWRFIALRMVNENVDYEAQFPPEYKALHIAGLRLLRIAAKVRHEYGSRAVGSYYAALGTAMWDSAAASAIRPAWTSSSPSLPLQDFRMSWRRRSMTRASTPLLRQETDEALALTGKDVGTPILHFQPPDGVAFFGPVISRLPHDSQALELWDHVIGLARFSGFSELKRSLRELPQLRALGISEDEVGLEEDWHGGSRKLKK